jgi:hypothetical protein
MRSVEADVTTNINRAQTEVGPSANAVIRLLAIAGAC